MRSGKRAGRPIRIGISSCVLGEKVRYDGGHKHDPIVTDLLSRRFTWVAVCPEAESGMGIPREPVRLTGDPERPRMVGIQTATDYTRNMERFSRVRVKALRARNLSGFILKARSPSCGMARVKIHRARGRLAGRKARGIFARHLMTGIPHLPVEEEDRLHDRRIRENFIERVFCYDRWRVLRAGRITRGKIEAFHAAHSLLIRSHSAAHLRRLGRLVADARQFTPSRLATLYGALFFEALARPAAPRRHAAVLRHTAGLLERQLSEEERGELHRLIEDFRRGRVPLVIPVTLLRHYARMLHIDTLADQIYLNPHPKELMLRDPA
jgi:uncharacterized protein YbgA (DUF1722 family)/uncharacterized protein YbbK (DUF523 family)